MAAIPFRLECSKESGFVRDPNQQNRFGFVTSLMFGGTPKLELEQDLTVAVAVTFNGNALPAALTPAKPTDTSRAQLVPTATVVGVLERFEWNGGAGDALELEFYLSQQNATKIKSTQQQASASPTVPVDRLAWWIADYDQETRTWFEQAYPVGPRGVRGAVPDKDHPGVDVDLNPVPVKDGIDVNVYKVTMRVAPLANQSYMLHFATSSAKKVPRPWGLTTAGAPPGPPAVT